MIWSRTADMLTGIRATLALLLAWLGFAIGASGLPLATLFLLICWTTDFFDGRTARRNPQHVPSRLGAHDLEVDMSASAGALVYLAGAEYVSGAAAMAYALAWLLIFWRYGLSKATGSLMQAPIYAWFLWVAAQDAPRAFRWAAIWLALSLLLTWRNFFYRVVPEFLDGMQRALRES